MAKRGSVLVTRPAFKLTVGLLLVMLPAQADPISVASLPVEQRENYDAFRVRCSKCHTLAKPMNVRLPADGWKRYVGKMARRPGSGISEQTGTRIVDFLVYKDSHDLAAASGTSAAVADGGL